MSAKIFNSSCLMPFWLQSAHVGSLLPSIADRRQTVIALRIALRRLIRWPDRCLCHGLVCYIIRYACLKAGHTRFHLKLEL